VDSGAAVIPLIAETPTPRQSPAVIELSSSERNTLLRRARKYTSPYCDVVRARIILLAATGLDNKSIAARLDTPRQIVVKWRHRFCRERIAGLQGRPRAKKVN
jgi:hypothetical protein